jgi:radial spoke head protein 9
MVQLEPNLQLVLKHLAGSGAVLTAESTVRSAGCAACSPASSAYDPCAWCLLQAAVDHSLPIKRREAGLQTLVLWGRLLARNGRVRASQLP